MIERVHEVSDPPCGVPGHDGGHWDDVVLGIWWCPDCRTEIWATEEVDGDWTDADEAEAGAGARLLRPFGPAVPVLSSAVPDGGDAAGAPADRAPGDGVGWRDRDGGARLWQLILEAFGRAAE